MTSLASIALLFAGGIASFYAGFCLLGGPDGAILSRESLSFGVPILLLAALLIHISMMLVPLRAFVFAPALVAVLAWGVALAISQKAGFYTWLAGTPVAIVASLGYWVVARFFFAVGNGSA